MFFFEGTSELLTFVAALLITFGLYDQALRVWKRESADDLSLPLVASVLLNEVMWLNYGVHLLPAQKVVAAVPALNIPAAIILAVGYFKFRNNDSGGESEWI